MKVEYQTFGFEIQGASESKAHGDNKGMIKGYASTFGNIDQGLDIVEPGAFAKTLEESDGKIPILSSHNPHEQIGWNIKASEDDRGLFVEGELDIHNNQKAREHFYLIKKALEIGAKPGLSIGYIVIKAEPDRDNPQIRRLKELKLMEYSPVSFPMNEMAMATQVKNWGSDTVEEAVKNFLECMEKQGFSKEKVFDSIKEQTEDNPDELLQLLSQSNKILKELKQERVS